MRSFLIFAAVALGWLPATVFAGIVVLKSGDVIVAEIDLKASDKRSLALRGPIALYALRASRLGDGKLTILRNEVRWFDAKARSLGPEYFEAFPPEKFPLSPRFRKNAPTPPIPEAIDLPLDLETLKDKVGRLDPKPIAMSSWSICKPRGWKAENETAKEGSALLLRPEGKKAPATRIRVRVVARSEPTEEKQRARYLAELRQREEAGATEVVEKPRELKKKGRRGLVLTTATRSKGPRVLERRHVIFLDDKVAFVTGTARARDFDKLSELTRLVASTLKVKED